MARRAMTSEAASFKKRRGHAYEKNFAQITGGNVNRGDKQSKKDVIDKYDGIHSVKGGTWSQIFLYAESRWKNNTVFQGIGEISPLMIKCLKAFPKEFEDYKRTKQACKEKLQRPMKELLNELSKPKILRAFLSKALFNGDEVDYLTIRRSDGIFHVFEREEVLNILCSDFISKNSIAIKQGDMPCQKVLHKAIIVAEKKPINVSEIEVRADEKQYRRMKCRFHAGRAFILLERGITKNAVKHKKIIAYGKAIKTFKL